MEGFEEFKLNQTKKMQSNITRKKKGANKRQLNH